MRRRYDKYQPSKSGVNGGNRACLCKHKDTYSRECCDGGLWAQGIGSIQASTSIYTVGQAALGGIIAYILQPGDTGYDAGVQKGFVATTADLSFNSQWGCYGTLIVGADGIDLGTGNQNTIDIMAGCATAGIAARLCGDLTEGGYSDWYLPSKDELNKLWINRVAIGGFDNDADYWCSTEYDNNFAWTQYFNDGSQFYFPKTSTKYVRAIRSF